MAEKQITGFGKKAAPNSRTTKDSEHFELLAVNATFDGSGASADFLPTVVILSDSGEVVGRFTANAVVTAGDSAEVTFAPFLRASTFGFIHWGSNTDPTGTGLTLVGTGGGFSTQTAGGGWEVDTDAGDVNFLMRGGTFFVKTGSGGEFNVATGALVYTEADDRLAMFPSTLSFFGAPGTGQAATPVTLGDVIALLQGFGLAA